MKTTVEIAPSLLSRVQSVMRREKVTLRSLIEEGLAKVVDERLAQKKPFKLKKASVGGQGIAPEFADAGWDAIRNEIYAKPNHDRD